MATIIARKNRLRSYTTIEAILTELTTYTKNKFSPDNAINGYRDFVDEPQITTWTRYIAEAEQLGIYETLKKYLIQFQFPIQENISQTDEYKNATLRGANPQNLKSATGLVLQAPEQLKLSLYTSIAGNIPVLIVENRTDFLSIIRALSGRNEPKPIPDSMGAAMIKGLNNWDRLRTLKRNWQNNPNPNKGDLLSNKSLYQDRIIVLSRIPYSNVSAEMMGLTSTDWLDKSLKIRLEHECAHYFTLRHFGKMANNMHDELIADYMGICGVLPSYKSDWFLKFIGLEAYPNFRTDGRLKNYLGKPALSTSAFKVLQTIIKNAADNLEVFDQQISISGEDADRKLRLLTLCHLNLVDIAAEEGVELLSEVYRLSRVENRDRQVQN